MATALLSARRDAGGGLLEVALDVAPEQARSYVAPGQYVEVTTPAGRGYFVLGGAVGRSRWELLVRNAGEAAAALASLPLGSPVELTDALGAGFPIAHASSRAVVVAVVGSAVAVARSVIDLRLAEKAAPATLLFLGLRAPTDLPIADEIAAWAEMGVHVVLCLSRSELDHHREILPDAERVAGYVQHAVATAIERGVVAPGALVVAAGPDGMLADLRALVTARAAALGPHVTPIEVVTNV